MAELIAEPPGALVYAGQETTRADIRAATREHLIGGKGMHHLTVDDLLADRPGLVVPAWWAGDNLGFCCADNPDHDVQPVTVVNLPEGINSVP